jgi:hypothetical protein
MHAGIDFRFRGVLIITEMPKIKKTIIKKYTQKYLSQNKFNSIF